MTDIKIEIYRARGGHSKPRVIESHDEIPTEGYAVRIEGHLFGRLPEDVQVHSTPAASIPDSKTVQRFQRLARAGKRPSIELIECKACGRIGVAIDDHRITSHKCAGQWTAVWQVKQSLPTTLLRPWREAADAREQRWKEEKEVRDRECAKATRQFQQLVKGYSGEEILEAFRRITPRGRSQWMLDHFVNHNPEMRTKRVLAEHWGRQGHYTCADFVRDVPLEKLRGSLLKVRATPTIRYHYRGLVRGTRSGWIEGFSEGERATICYPWMTRRQCQADAKARGGQAAFYRDGRREGAHLT